MVSRADRSAVRRVVVDGRPGPLAALVRAHGRSASCCRSPPARPWPSASASTASISSSATSLFFVAGAGRADRDLVPDAAAGPPRGAGSSWSSALVLMLADAVRRHRGQGRPALDRLPGLSMQPSEFMKPAFVVLVAWLFAENARRARYAGQLFAAASCSPSSSSLLVAAARLRPDDAGRRSSGRALFFVAGMPWLWMAGFGAAGAVGGIVAAYAPLPHVAAPHRPLPRSRVGRHLPGRHGAASRSCAAAGSAAARARARSSAFSPTRTPTSSSRSRPRSSASSSASLVGALRLHRAARPVAAPPERRPVRAARRRRARRAVRRAVGHQHGGQPHSCRPRA